MNVSWNMAMSYYVQSERTAVEWTICTLEID